MRSSLPAIGFLSCLLLLFAACHDEAGERFDSPIVASEVLNEGYKAEPEVARGDAYFSYNSAAADIGLPQSGLTSNNGIAIPSGTSAANAITKAKSAVDNSRPSPPPHHGRKIIWNADIKYQVSDVDSATRAIQEVVDLNGGFIAEMNKQRDAKRFSNTIRIRVQNQYFHELVDKLKTGVTRVDLEKLTSNDVTEEFVDVQSRLKTKKQARDRYIDILRTKTGKVKDIIEAEEAIRRITEEIESKEGRLRYLRDRVSLCTVDLNIYEMVEAQEPVVAYTTSFGMELGDAFGEGSEFVKNAMLFLVTIWPLLLILAIVYLWKGRMLQRIFVQNRNKASE